MFRGFIIKKLKHQLKRAESSSATWRQRANGYKKDVYRLSDRIKKLEAELKKNSGQY